MASGSTFLLMPWRFDPALILPLVVAALIYLRGWQMLRYERPHKYTPERLASFISGLGLIVLALDSPLDALAAWRLPAHMVQHLILLMGGPPLIWAGQPLIPLMRGLPGRLLKDGVGPFLQSGRLRSFGRFLIQPVTCFLFFAIGMNFWHLPKFYELALSSLVWHRVEHVTFLLSALLFWWPVIGVWPAEPVWPRWVVIPYLLFAEVAVTPVSAWLAFSSHIVYPSYGTGQAALDDQAVAGALMWVPGSIVLLISAFVVTMELVGRRSQPSVPERSLRRERFDLIRLPVLRWRHFRRIPQAVMFLLALFVMVEGFRDSGTALPPVWVYWRGLTVLVLLFAGNLFCMACPFKLTSDVIRQILRPRLNPRLKWPRALRSGWFSAAVFALYLWAYEIFGLWRSPWLTAWVVAGYFLAILVVDSIFEGASFCRYVCPIGRFQAAGSVSSPLEVTVRSQAPCASCATHDCLHSCDMQLYVPVKQGNYDCTFCMECVHACPSDNVGVFPILPASKSPRRNGSDIVIGIFVAAALVSAAAMADPVMSLLHRWPHSMTLFYIAGLAVLPFTAAFLAGGNRRKFAFALAPLGFSMWLAHFGGHLNTVLNLFAPDSSIALQLIALDGGLLLALWSTWKAGHVFRWGAIAVVFYAICVWTLFQPMAMRGMVMKW